MQQQADNLDLAHLFDSFVNISLLKRDSQNLSTISSTCKELESLEWFIGITNVKILLYIQHHLLVS